MARRTATLLGTLIAVSVAATCPALADVYYVTYTGTASGTDTYGLFGTAGGTLSGAAFTSTYTYNPAQFGSAISSGSSGYTQIYGGSAYGVTDPLLSAALTINARTFYQGSSYVGNEEVDSPPYIASLAESSASNYLQNNGYLAGSPTLSLTAAQAFSFSNGNYGSLGYNGETIHFTETYVSVTDGPPAVVPEPT